MVGLIMNIKIKIFLSMVIVIAVSLIIALATYILLNIFKSASEDETRYFNIAIGHINDFHARFEEISPTSGTCKDDGCVGGFARLVTMFKETKDDTNYIFLNAGDNFQGTLWYNIFKWNVTAYFMNKLPFDAFTLGNHEFDDDVAGVVPFIENLEAPVVVSNIDDSEEPTMQGIYKKSVVITRDGQIIGIIGVILSTANIIAKTGKLKFLGEIESVNKEAKRLVEEEKVFTNIVLSHCGYSVEQEIAKHAKHKIGVIVGAHSHSLLYTGNPPSGEEPQGPYPTVVRNEDGFMVLVVQASAYTKYFGKIKVVYNKHGLPIDWSGQPIYMNQSITPDTKTLEELQPWKETIAEIGNEVLGATNVDLSVKGCFTGECTLGNFITDAMVEAWKEAGVPDATIALVNPGSLRSTIPKGSITFNDIITSQPFGNTFDCGELQGKYIKEAFEFATKPYDNKKSYSDIYIPQVSGIQVVFELTNPPGSKVTSLKVKCQKCSTPTFEDVIPEAYYKIIIPSFITGGGDGFTAISDNIKNLKIGPVDIDYYRDYIQRKSPFNTKLEGRITVKGQENVKTRIVK